MGWSPQLYAWPLLTSLFTDTFSKAEWVKIFDHLFLRHEEPELLFYLLVAYLICSKPSILQISCIEDMTRWLHQPTSVPFDKVWKLAEKLHQKHKATVSFGNLQQNLPICSSNESGQVYQPFVRYPDHFVAFQNNLREKIVNDEEEIQKKN